MKNETIELLYNRKSVQMCIRDSMYMMLEEAKGKLIVNRSMLRALGKDVQLFDGVSDWFARVNDYAESKGLVPEHYIISSGLKEIIEGTPIAKEFKAVSYTHLDVYKRQA